MKISIVTMKFDEFISFNQGYWKHSGLKSTSCRADYNPLEIWSNKELCKLAHNFL